jgi:hypothetical protein
MYRVVREALEIVECAHGLAALSALEEQERDAPGWCPAQANQGCDCVAECALSEADKSATPPAPPAAECASCGELRSELEILRSAVEVMKVDLAAERERWTDENGTVWNRPTAWAYQQACRTLRNSQSELAEAERTRDAALERLREIGEQLEFDRTKVAECLVTATKAINERDWLTEGRGPYEWDDDKWHEEFYAAAVEIRAALEPLSKIAANWKYCPKTAEETALARIDLKAKNAYLAAELKQAVDALRDAAEFLHAAQNNYTVNWAVVDRVDDALAAYDAKHGEGK